MKYSLVRIHGLWPLLVLALLLPAQAQRQVPAAFPTPQETSAQEMTLRNAKAGKPATLNGIRETLLSNGLTVLTKEVHAAPVVYFSVWYKVGSVDESMGETGMSHLMEHMMFKGTKTRGPGVISATLSRNGAEFDASTSLDRTNYFETLASDRLELAMQIESDRMVNSVYNEAQHQHEMTVVRSEYENGENNPGEALDKAVRLAAYQVHPYRWETIGFRADIENFSRDEMYAYYKNYYAPNNAVVVMVGDFQTAAALVLMRKYFGALSAHPIAQHFITPEPVQEGERRVIVRRAGTTPQIEIAYHIPGFGDPDHYALDVLETVLSSGRTGRFFQDLVQTGIASDAGAGDNGQRDPDLLTVDAAAQPGHTNADLEKALLAEVDKIQTAPITSEELSRAIAQAEAGYILGQDSVEDQGAILGENAMRGDWRYGENYVANLKHVTAADVQRVAQKYLTVNNRTVGDFEPILSAPGAENVPASLGGSRVTPSAPRLAPARKPMAWFHRMPGPALRPNSVIRMAAPSPKEQGIGLGPTRVVLPNGLTVIVQENHANPTVSISGAVLSAGGVFDTPQTPELAELTASQLSRGTQTRSLLDIARTLENVGASAEVGGGEEYASLGGRSLTKDFPVVLDILSDELRHPSFPADELEKSKAQELAGIDDARSDTGALSSIAFSDAAYPVGHPFHSPTLDESAAFIKTLTRDQLLSFYRAHYGPERTVITIVGDVNAQDTIAAVTKYFGDWQKQGSLPALNIPTVTAPTGAIKTIVISVPDKAQTDVIYGYAGQLRRTDPDFYAVTVLNYILGGSTLTGRLGGNVRDRLGLVYNIVADENATLGAGPFTVDFGANPENVDAAVAEMNRQILLLRDQGVTQAEVNDAVAYLTGSYPLTLSTNSGISQVLLVEEIYGLGLDYVHRRAGIYNSLTVAQINAAAKKYLHPGTGALVIAGTYSGKYAPGK